MDITNEDLLRIIGWKEVQGAVLAKELEDAKRELARLRALIPVEPVKE